MTARITLKRNGRGYVYEIRGPAGKLWASGWVRGSQATARAAAKEQARGLGLNADAITARETAR